MGGSFFFRNIEVRMKIKLAVLTLLMFSLSVLARDKMIRKGVIITEKDTIQGFVDISTDFNYKVYYKRDSKNCWFKRLKSTHVVKVLYDDKVFEWIEYNSQKIMSLKVEEGDVSLYADFLPSITPGNNSSMFTSTQTNKTIKVYYLVKGEEVYELNAKNYLDVTQLVFSSKPVIHQKMEGLSYPELFDQLPELVFEYNQN